MRFVINIWAGRFGIILGERFRKNGLKRPQPVSVKTRKMLQIKEIGIFYNLLQENSKFSGFLLT